MPLYDYGCRDGHLFERVIPLAEFAASRHLRCECGATAERIIVRAPATHGLTTPGSEAWDCGGMWTGRDGANNPTIREAHQRFEADDVAEGVHRQRGLAVLRAHEMAVEGGLHAEARSLEGSLRQILSDSDRVKRGDPQVLTTTRGGTKIVRRVRNETTRRRDGRTVHRPVVSIEAA